MGDGSNMIPRSISRRPLRAVAFAAIVLLLVYSFNGVSFSDFGGRGYHSWRWQSSAVSPFNETGKSPRATVARDVQILLSIYPPRSYVRFGALLPSRANPACRKRKR